MVMKMVSEEESNGANQLKEEESNHDQREGIEAEIPGGEEGVCGEMKYETSESNQWKK